MIRQIAPVFFTSGIRGQTERFLVSFEKTSFADNDWRFSEWGELPVYPHV